MLKLGVVSKSLASAVAGATGLVTAATAQEVEPGRDAQWRVAAGPSLSIIDANNMGNSDDPTCDTATTDCRRPGGAIVGGNNLETGLALEVGRRSGHFELAGSAYHGCSDFHFLATHPGDGENCATDLLAHGRVYTHEPDARWSAYAGALGGYSRQSTSFSGTIFGRPDLDLRFGGDTNAAVYGAEFGVEGRFASQWAVRVGCSWRQTTDNRLPVYVGGVRDVREPAEPGGPNGDQSWHRTTAGCGVNLVATLK